MEGAGPPNLEGKEELWSKTAPTWCTLRERDRDRDRDRHSHTVAHLGSRASPGAKVSGLYGTLIWGDGLLPDAPQQTEACHLLP